MLPNVHVFVFPIVFLMFGAFIQSDVILPLLTFFIKNLVSVLIVSNVIILVENNVCFRSLVFVFLKQQR